MSSRSPDGHRDIRRRLRSVGVAGLAVVLAVAGCSGQSTEVAVVAGGGDDPEATTPTGIQLDGAARDLAVGGGVVYLLASGAGDREYSVVAIDGDTVTHVDTGDARLGYVAAGSDGTAYVAGQRQIYRVEGTQLEPVAEAQGSSTISGLAVGPDGEPVWSEGFLGVGPDGDDMSLGRIQRLSGGSVERVAGIDESPVDAEEVVAWRTAPPDDLPADEFPLERLGHVAVDADGTVYMIAGDVIQRFAPGGEVSVVTGPGERAAPEEPYSDEGDAADFGGSWSQGDLDVDDGRVVAVDSSLEHEPAEVGPFAWAGDMSDGAQELAETIVRQPRADGTFDLDISTTALERVAVLIGDGRAATAAAHVAAVAIEGDTLYLAGQTRETGQSDHDDAEILIVSTHAQDG